MPDSKSAPKKSAKKARMLSSIKGGPPLGAQNEVCGGAVFDKRFTEALTGARCRFAIMDWCSDKYNGGVDVFEM